MICNVFGEDTVIQRTGKLFFRKKEASAKVQQPLAYGWIKAYAGRIQDWSLLLRLSLTFLSISCTDLCSKVSGTAMFSRTVKLSKRKYSWKMKPRLFLRKSADCSWPSFSIWVFPIIICPLVGTSIVDKTFRRVVLPDPEAPMIPIVV